MNAKTRKAIEDLKAMGMTAAEAYDRVVLAAVAPVETVAASPVAVAATPTAPVTPDWLKARGDRKAQRRALAHDPAVIAAIAKAKTPAAKAAVWAKAKADAGITALETAAHAAFVASKAN